MQRIHKELLLFLEIKDDENKDSNEKLLDAKDMYKKELLTYSSFIHEYSKVTFVNDVCYIIELKEAIGNNEYPTIYEVVSNCTELFTIDTSEPQAAKRLVIREKLNTSSIVSPC